jgi:beta-glucosidase
LRYDAPAIERLNIPAYNWWSEALHGVARAGPATVFPQAIGLAATWDTDLMHEIATVISDEARAKHHAFAAAGRRDIYQGLTFFSPNINIFRDPRWGRGQETFGEDPFLTGRLAVQFIRGLQGDDPRYLKVAATAKHYAVHSGPEPLRHTFDARPTEQDLWDTYLPAFEASVREADVESVMCAYSRFRGEPACGSTELLDGILRRRWGFGGYVVSDCWAVDDFYQRHKVVATAEEAVALAVRRGTDLECGAAYGPYLGAAVEQRLLSEFDITRSVERVLASRFRLGMFDPPESVPYTRIPYDVVGSDAHRALALRAARESIVLLANDGVLPLSKALKSVAVIGPNARSYQVLLGNYHGTPRTVSYPADAIRAALGGGDVVYAQGTDIAPGLPALMPVPASALRAPDGQRGLAAAYFGNQTWSGEPKLARVDSMLDFIWLDRPPLGGGIIDSFSVRWTGRLVAPVTGRYRIALRGMNGARVWFEDSLRVDFSNRHGADPHPFDADLEAGREYELRVDYFNFGPDPQAQLLWHVPGRDLQPEALAVARAAEAVVLFLGLAPELENEELSVEVEGFAGGDRTSLELPRPQRELLERIVALGKPTVLVLLSGSPVSLPPAMERVGAIVQAWYPGEAGGQAIADVLFGDYNPAGRLPLTFYRSVADLPPFEDYGMEGRTYRYFRGEPLFPFGHGLSYTKFAYGRLRLPARLTEEDTAITVSVEVTNEGGMPGDEVVQVYVSHTEAEYRVPVRTLAAFRRVTLQPGQTTALSFTLTMRQLRVVGTHGLQVLPSGRTWISVGGKQPGFRGAADAATTQALRGVVEIGAR